MYLLLCTLWPYLAGGLIAWLLSGWLARRLKYQKIPREKIVERKVEVERRVDNPDHISLINTLTAENEKISGLHVKLAELENRKPEIIEKIVEVEKRVDNPEHLALIDNLKAENDKVSGLHARIIELENRKSEVVEKKVEIEKLVDNPQHLNKIHSLEAENNAWKRGPVINIAAARVAGIGIKAEDDFTAIEGVGPKISELIHAEGINTFRQLSDTSFSQLQQILNRAGPSYQMANPGTWPDQANLAASNRWPALKALQDILDGGVYPDTSSESAKGSSAQYISRISALEAELESYRNVKESSADLVLAKAAGFKVRQKGGMDDFTVVEGIGPKINDLIHADGLHFYADLARTEIAHIQNILDEAGSNFRLAKPGTWPDQSNLAAKNEWQALKQWQDELDGGTE